MKKWLLILTILISVIAMYSFSVSENKTKEGIRFSNGNWNQVLLNSKDAKKPVFIDFSTSWCGYCKKMKRNVFVDDEVATFYNSNFINLDLDAEHGLGDSLARVYGVKNYPTFVIVDSVGKVIQFSEGYLGKTDFIKLGKSSLYGN